MLQQGRLADGGSGWGAAACANVLLLQGAKHFRVIQSDPLCCPLFLLLLLQGAKHFKDIQYAQGVTYGEMFLQSEYEMSGERGRPGSRLLPVGWVGRVGGWVGERTAAAAWSAVSPAAVAPAFPHCPTAPPVPHVPHVPPVAVYNLDEADVEGQRKRFDLYNEVQLLPAGLLVELLRTSCSFACLLPSCRRPAAHT